MKPDAGVLKASGEEQGLVLKAIHTFAGGPFSLLAYPGDCIGIRGASGAGKSLLLRAIADLDVHEGAVLWNGRPREEWSAPDWRRCCAYLAASPVWWEPTLAAHFPAGHEPDWKAVCLPEGIRGREPQQLSSGESQRAALLRLLARRPEILLLDEPTANVDETSEAAVEALLLKLCREARMLVLWVSHDLKQLERVAGRILRLTPEGLETEK